MTPRPKIVLLGMLTKMPVGGVAWLVGQYVIGFERLGYDVYYVEAHARTPSMFIDHADDDGTDRAAAYLAGIMHRFGLDGRWALHALHADGRCVGMTSAELARLYRDAALIINMHGGTVPLPEHTATGRLVLLSTDPVELELEIARDDTRAIEFVEAHVASFTWGLNFGNPDCRLPWAPKHGFVPSPPPIALDQWTSVAPPADAAFTTIGNWRQQWREISFEGERYTWSKHDEFLKLVDLPRKVSAELQLALSSATDADRAMLRAHGWSIEDGLAVSTDMDDYRAYLHASKGEFTVAKDQNVRFRSGWFSERSACYLASGRPVIMQDTGFGNALPTGEGLLPFTDLDSAAAAIEEVVGNEERHRRGALEVAATYLSYDVVLPDMLRRLGLPARAGTRWSDSRLPPAAPASLPHELALVPVSRRPLVLPPETESTVLARPVPSVAVTDEHPAASVLIVVHDNLTVSRMAIESVLANTAGAYEIVVVDNGSQAETRQYLSVVSARNPHVRLIVNDANRGFAPAVNQALAIARGTILVLLNNDVVVPPGWLDGLADRLGDTQVGLVGPVTNRCGNEAEVPAPYATYGELLAFVDARRDRDVRSFDIPVATMFCVAMRRDTFDLVGLLDERYEIGLFEDDDYSRRVRAAGLRVMCTPDVFVHHFGEASIGRLAADGSYGAVFDANRHRYEQKWGEIWRGHDRLPDPQYSAMVARVRAAIDEVVPADGVALVVSRGDEQMVPATDPRVRHFPSTDTGEYCGHHPADDADAIGQLQRRRTEGATHLVIPASSDWWLTHYQGFALHLTDQYQQLLHEPETAVIFALDPPRRPGAAAKEGEPHAPLTADDAGGPVGVEPGGDDDVRRQLAALIAEREELRRQLQEATAPSVARVLSQITSRLDHMEDLLDEVLHPELSSPTAETELVQRWRELVRRNVGRGESVLIATTPSLPAFDVAGRRTSDFSLQCDHLAGAATGGCPCAVARLEARRAQGAEHLLVPSSVGVVDDRLADHLIGRFELKARGESGLLFDLHTTKLTAGGWPRALSACAAWLVAVLEEDVAFLDWTGLGLVGRIGPRNVFHVEGQWLPHIDHSVPVVLVDDPDRLGEAARVASAAVLLVSNDVRPVVIDVHAIDNRVAEAAAVADDDAADLVLFVEPGVVPLPGCVDAARSALAAAGVGAVAVKLYADDGSLGAAGVAVFADGSWSGIATGAADPSAPWHEYRRDTCAGAGMLVLRADVASTISKIQSSGMDLLGLAAAVWDAGLRVVYEPEAEAVHTASTPDAFAGPPSDAWAAVAPARPIRPTHELDDVFWRSLLATDDVAACWHKVEEVV